MRNAVLALILSAAFAIGGCSSPSEPRSDAAATQNAAATTDDDAMGRAGNASATTMGTPDAPGASSIQVLTLEGLGGLEVGKPVPAGSSFAERGAQINETCRTVSSPAYPGVYALVENDEVRRISVGERSDVKLIEGVGLGATQADVLAVFPGFRSSPHKYMSAPGKYLTQPGNDPRLRFEIGENGRVSLIHVGMMPQLGYVEGCA